jgi:hypothetical protein
LPPRTCSWSASRVVSSSPGRRKSGVRNMCTKPRPTPPAAQRSLVRPAWMDAILGAATVTPPQSSRPWVHRGGTGA